MALPDEELITLLADLESDRVERKENAANSDRLSEAICAFANDMPGYGEPGVLFVGVSTMTVRKLRVESSEVAVVEVRPSAAPPVRFKGRVYIRVGPRRAIASLDEERRRNDRRRSLDLPFDSRPIPGSSLADLDTYAFTAVLLPALLPRDVLADNERSTEQRLAALRLTSQGEPHGCLSRRGRNRATVEQRRASHNVVGDPPFRR